MMKDKKILSYGFKSMILLAGIAFISFAWLNNRSEINPVNNLYLNTQSRGELLISVDGGITWDSRASVSMLRDAEFRTEITGDGSNFYYATNKRDDGTPVSFGRTTNVNVDYFEFDILFKTNEDGGLFLSSNSYLRPQAGTTSDLLIGPNVERKSSSGDFSTDLIASSMRLAFIKNNRIDGEYIPESMASLVWAPNKKYEVSCTSTSCIASIDSNNPQNYSYINASDVSDVYEDDVHNLKDELRANFDENSAYGEPMLMYLDTSENGGVSKLTIRVWVEGNDRDNLTALTGGMFVLNLDFATISKQINSDEPQVSTNGTSIGGYDSNVMEYSINNGLTWESENSPTFVGQQVLVRYKENGAVFASTYKTLNF